MSTPVTLTEQPRTTASTSSCALMSSHNSNASTSPVNNFRIVKQEVRAGADEEISNNDKKEFIWQQNYGKETDGFSSSPLSSPHVDSTGSLYCGNSSSPSLHSNSPSPLLFHDPRPTSCAIPFDMPRNLTFPLSLTPNGLNNNHQDTNLREPMNCESFSPTGPLEHSGGRNAFCKSIDNPFSCQNVVTGMTTASAMYEFHGQCDYNQSDYDEDLDDADSESTFWHRIASGNSGGSTNLLVNLPSRPTLNSGNDNFCSSGAPLVVDQQQLLSFDMLPSSGRESDEFHPIPFFGEPSQA